jgi:hypothetical protein
MQPYTDFDPFEELQRLQASHIELNQAMARFSQLIELNNSRMDNFLTILANQQKQIDIIWQQTNQENKSAK